MPNKFRVVFLFQGLQDGWSETHVFDTAVANPQDLKQPMKNIMAKRALMLGNNYRGIGIRIRLVQATDGTPIKRAAFPVLDTFLPSGSADNAGDPDFVACLGVGTDPTGQHQTRVFLGGIPDATSGDGGTVDGGKPASNPYLARFNDWGAAMASQQGPQGQGILPGYFSFVPIGTFDVLGYTIGTDTRATFTFPADTFPPELLNFVLKARFSRLNGSRSLLNKEMLVYITSDSTVKSVKPEAAGPFTGQGQAILYPTVPTFIGVSLWQLSPNVARHKRGRPFSRSRGRLPARPTT